jgi:hypothetical protein
MTGSSLPPSPQASPYMAVPVRAISKEYSGKWKISEEFFI